MAILRRFLCWNLRTAIFVGLVQCTVTAFFALLLRALDLAAAADNDPRNTALAYFEISQGFRTPWRSHQWIAFLALDIIMIVAHITILIVSLLMMYMVLVRHFVMYMNLIRLYTYVLIFYLVIECCFAIMEFSFYGVNTFRLAFVVFLWLYWLARLGFNSAFVVALIARSQEMEDEMATELRFSDRKFAHSYM